MGPKPRIEFPGAMHHVTGRGNAKAPIFCEPCDYEAFLELVAEAVALQGWLCHAYCLIPNHYHLLFETPEPNLGKGMLRVNGTYARRFNWRYSRVGHVFQGPYGDTLVKDDDHLAEVARYLALNPVRAGLVDSPDAWPWSSHRAFAGLRKAPAFLNLDGIRSLLGGGAGYRRFVADAMHQPKSPAGRLSW